MSARYQAIFGEYLRRVLPGERSHELARELILFSTKEREAEAREKGYREDSMDPAHEHEFDPNFDSAAGMLNDMALLAARNLIEREIRKQAAKGKRTSSRSSSKSVTPGMRIEDEAQSVVGSRKKQDPAFQVSDRDREREAKEYRESMKVGDVGEVGMVTEYGVLTSEKKKEAEQAKKAEAARNGHDELHEETMKLDGDDKKDPHDKMHEDTMRMDDPDAAPITNEDPEREEEKESDMSLGGLANSFL